MMEEAVLDAGIILVTSSTKSERMTTPIGRSGRWINSKLSSVRHTPELAHFMVYPPEHLVLILKPFSVPLRNPDYR
jgi:hypothetical protein